MSRFPVILLRAIAVGSALAAAFAHGQQPTAAATSPPRDWEWFGQITNVTQEHPSFRSPYRGDNSLDPSRRIAETTDITLYAGVRLWRGAEAWVNPEVDQGFGLSDTLGAAGFPSGEAYKVGADKPYWRLPRAFVRQVIDLNGSGGKTETVEAAANQLAGTRPVDNVTLTLGKFGVPDVFDSNRYAHDPRADFLNWSIIDAGAFDYAADSWGFTYGAAAEWTRSWWTLRAGLFQLSPVPNGKIIRPTFNQQMWVTEVEARHDWMGHPGKVKLLVFLNHGKMGAYRDAIDLARSAGGVPDTALVRRVADNVGYAVNVEQEISTDLGFFLRASTNSGRKEAYEFTEINRSISLGFALRGAAWGRADDTFGLGAAFNGLSADARGYFAAGGLGILIGDGALNYASERVTEAYYSARLAKQATVSINYQNLANPAHNRDRGPVSVYGVRLHLEF